MIEAALPDSTVLQGLAVQGKVAQEDPERTKALIEPWLEELNMKKTGTDAEAEVLAAYEAIQQAMIDKDIEALDRLYQDGTLNYFAYDIHDPQITVDGDEAVLTASVTLTAKVYGASGSWTLPVNAHFTKTGGQWIAHN